MALIIRDNSVYLSTEETMRMGTHRGVPLGTLIEEFPDYIRYLLDNQYITLAGEAEEAYRLALIKLENKERDGDMYDLDTDAWSDGFWDDQSDESIADYT